MKTRLLLICGAIAGPLFTLVWLIAGAARPGYDPLRHPISSLSIGPLGWTQMANFLLTGLLTLAFAFGLRRALRSSTTWGPLLVAVMAIGFLGAGIFVTDPMGGYPPGTPDLPLQYSLTGRLHRLFSALVFLGLPIACFVFARLFASWGQRRWATYSRLTGIAFVVLFVVTSVGFAGLAPLVDYAGLLQRLSLTIGWLWMTLLAVYMLGAPAR